MSTLEVRRRRAQRLMVDTGTALRPTGGMEYIDGRDQVATEPLFASKGKAQTRSLVAREAEVGGRTSTSVRTELHLPADTDPLAVGDLWEWTEVHPPSLCVVGQRFRVLAPVAGSFKTARRYEVEEVVS